jgi:transposase-like protein
MKKKNTKPGQAENETLREIPLACRDEAAAVEFIEKQRWGNTPACPHCGSINVRKMTDGNGNRNKRFLWRCKDCKQQYTVRIGTVFEDSRIPLNIWCHAFWRACASKKGVSALQISRECHITYKSALFLMHRIRFAMTEPVHEEKLKGTIEADETYVGGKPRLGGSKKHVDNRKNKRGRGTKKTPVFAIVERGGNVRANVVADVTAKTLGKIMPDNIQKAAHIMTDSYRSYQGIGRYFASHDVVRHDCCEYVRGDVYTNTVESFFSLLKRGLYGTFHAVSKKHLHRYVNEFAFRWDTRKINDGERIVQAIKRAEGKRLMYKKPTTKSA